MRRWFGARGGYESFVYTWLNPYCLLPKKAWHSSVRCASGNTPTTTPRLHWSIRNTGLECRQPCRPGAWAGMTVRSPWQSSRRNLWAPGPGACSRGPGRGWPAPRGPERLRAGQVKRWILTAVSAGLILERGAEIATVRAQLQLTLSGSGGAVAIVGPSGAGKTRLLEEVRRLAGEQGLRVLAGQASELERNGQFGLALQLFGPMLAAAQRH